MVVAEAIMKDARRAEILAVRPTHSTSARRTMMNMLRQKLRTKIFHFSVLRLGLYNISFR